MNLFVQPSILVTHLHPFHPKRLPLGRGSPPSGESAELGAQGDPSSMRCGAVGGIDAGWVIQSVYSMCDTLQFTKNFGAQNVIQIL